MLLISREKNNIPYEWRIETVVLKLGCIQCCGNRRESGIGSVGAAGSGCSLFANTANVVA